MIRLPEKYRIILFLLFVSDSLMGQSVRIHDRNSIAWYCFNTSLRFNERLGLHAEYQFRRVNWGGNSQQGLFRTGLNYYLNSADFVRFGYAHIETFSYGNYPINPYGKSFTEHRFFQMYQNSHQIGVCTFSNRYMLEQRWIGSYSSVEKQREDVWNFLNRIRYLGKCQWRLIKFQRQDRELYGLLYDEIFLGFGKNVKQNVFDQNRLGVQLGFRFNRSSRLEAGFFHQILQLSRTVAGANVFQFNAGYMLNYFHNLDFRGKEK